MLTARSLLADARALQSELAQEQQRLADTTIRAPKAGEEAKSQATTAPSGGGAADGAATQPPKPISYAVASRQTSIGEYVREGTPLFRLVADSPVKFRAQVAERFLGQVKVGQGVRVKVQAYPDTFAGTVTRISPAVDMASRAFQVEMLLPNEDGRLQPGSFARGAILTRVDPEVTLVPSDAVVTFAGVSKVFTVDEQNKAVEKKVELGQQVGDALEVTTGLKGAMPLVIDGRNKLATGTPVIPSPAAAIPATQQAITQAEPAPQTAR